MRQLTGTKKWLKEISDVGQARLREDRERRDEIVADESFDSDLDRLVLGMTGSVEELRRYQLLAIRIGNAIGKPVIVINEISQRQERVISASGGIIAGEVEADLKIHSTELNDRCKPKIERAELLVPVRPRGYYSDGHAYLVSPRDGRSDDDSKGLRIADFDLLRERANDTHDADKDWRQVVNPENILIGRHAIYEHPYFAKGVHRLMELVEEYTQLAAEESLSVQ